MPADDVVKSLVLVILQCAYGNTQRRREELEHSDEWLRGLWASHTGRRLAEMCPPGWDIAVCNASPVIGKKADAVFPPDPNHIAMKARKRRRLSSWLVEK